MGDMKVGTGWIAVPCLLCRCFYSRSFVPPPKPFCFESQHSDNPHVSLFSTVYLDKRISSEELGTHLRAFSPSLHHPLSGVFFFFFNVQILNVVRGFSVVILCFEKMETKCQ